MDDNLLALGGGIALTGDRRLITNNDLPSGPPGVETDETSNPPPPPTAKETSRDPRIKRKDSRSASPNVRRRSTSSSKPSGNKDASRDPRVKRRDSRSKSTDRRRRRSSSSSSTDKRRRRFDDRGGRQRGSRRSRSRDRPRSPFGRRRRDRSGSRDRGRRGSSRSRRNNWSPSGSKKGPVSPPPQIHQQQGLRHNNPFNPMNQIYDGGYNNYQSNIQQPYVQQPQQQPQYGGYDYGMQMQPQQAFTAYPPPPVMQPVPPGDDFQQAPPNWNEPPPQRHPGQVPQPIQQQQQQPQEPQAQPVDIDEDKKKREAVAREKKTQLATLRKQRDEYKRRSNALSRELKILKEQRTELVVGREPPSPTTKGFIKENDRLQLQIENKIATIENVIEMLSDIIGPASSPTPSPPRAPKIEASAPVPAAASAPISSRKKSNSEDDSSPERLKTKVLESIKRNKVESKLRDAPDMRRDVEPYSSGMFEEQKPSLRVNYVHYDPEMHWCQTCQVFPKTAKDFLTHLHSKDHQQMQKILESPWHEQPINDEMPTYSDAPTKRTPIRGLQFFVPTTGWYCKICFVWMGDLHCASLHLKSQTHAHQYQEYAAQNPSFEVDWMSDRQRAYEVKRESTSTEAFAVPPIPRGTSISDGIPLQIQVKSHASPAVPIIPVPLPAVVNEPVEEKRQKKKKRKQDDRKEKRKKKRSKKRKHQSSSSSSSSDSSDSEANVSPKKMVDKTKEESIRVAMRNLLKQQKEEKKKIEESGGKWTVIQPATMTTPVPPPPTISENGKEAKKKDDLLIAQWNEPTPVIDENERKLFEQLKGKMQSQNRAADREEVTPVAAVDAKVPERKEDSRDSRRRGSVDRERSRDRSRDRSLDRGRDRSLDRGRDRDRSLDRGRDRSLDRGRDRSLDRGRGRYDRGRDRRSRSRGRRSHSRSRSRSTGRYGRRRRSRSRSYRSRVEKPIVRYPEFRPRVPEPEPKKKRGDDDSKSDKKQAIKKQSSSASSAGSNKKLPFIGRMPVFKKQTTEEELRREEELKNPMEPMTEAAYGVPIEGHPPHQQHAMYHYDGMHQMAPEDYDNLMPDPLQFVSMMGAPPPPPMVPPPQQPDTNEPVLPPGIDEADAAQVIKTISDAPLPRKGPLPKDFQDALSIIFPGDRKPEDAETTPVAEPPKPPTEPIVSTPSIIAEPLTAEEVHQQQQAAVALQLQMDEQSQQSMDLYSAFAVVNGVAMLKTDLTATTYAEDMDIPEPLPVTQVPLPPEVEDDTSAQAEEEAASREALEAEQRAARQAELDDLAMLGIDADDLAAQCM